MKTSIRLAALDFSPNLRLAIVALLAMTLVLGGVSPRTLAAPDGSSTAARVAAQNVDWMSADTAATLDLPMDVLVPSWVPAPFDSVAPSVAAGGGYYSLYWMIPGGPTTFLYVEGTVGGALPAGSPANLNKALGINATVQGWNAIHDLGIPEGGDTPIYDQVWWIANGVLYTVSSNNMTGTDTMSLANSLVVLVPPAAEAPAPPPAWEPEPPVAPDPPSAEPVAPGAGQQAPVAETGGTGEVSDLSGAAVEGPAAPAEARADANVEPGTESAGGEETGTRQPSRDGLSWSPGRFDAETPSDGTNGPRPPVIGTDGTGGAYDNALPNIRFRP